MIYDYICIEVPDTKRELLACQIQGTRNKCKRMKEPECKTCPLTV